ncbi:hypothetical protein GE107_03600 [Cohnella sp. CFH 77786]|uniref:hypothetical protein n=1 Tax=Cohnella sp. CFH 77786 TaxID=2662265 RepID=UPI001C60EEE4|nr:hypothetical protein [Cohnella sp. CFH 77786]MBW5445148.1 hypothetical protein [Cohnella sp. CFH 77786]
MVFLRSASLLLLSLMIILSPINLNIANAASSKLPMSSEKVKKEFKNRPAKGQRIEIAEWRSANAKHFFKDDGDFQMEVSKDSIFYQDVKTKQWKDIDNTLVASDKKKNGFKNKANKFEVNFSSTTNDGSILDFTIGNAEIEFYSKEAQTSWQRQLELLITYYLSNPRVVCQLELPCPHQFHQDTLAQSSTAK